MTEPCGSLVDGQILTAYTVTLGEPEVRWRFGYKVIGCRPRLLGTNDRETAETRAKAAAGDVSRKMRELGGPVEVEWWIQEVLITAEALYAPPVGASFTEDEAAEAVADHGVG